MAEEKQPSTNTTELFWCWQDNMDGSYKTYEPQVSLQIESLQIGESSQIKVHHRLYLIGRTDEYYGYQQNLKTNFKRDICKCTKQQLENFNTNNLATFYKDKTFCWCWQNIDGTFIKYKQEINDKIELLKHAESTTLTNDNNEQIQIIRNNDWHGVQKHLQTLSEKALWKMDTNKLDEQNQNILQKQKDSNKNHKYDNNGIYFWCWKDNNGAFVPYHKRMTQYIDNLHIGQHLYQTWNNIEYKIERNDELNGDQINMKSGFKRKIWKFEINHLNRYNRQVEENCIKNKSAQNIDNKDNKSNNNIEMETEQNISDNRNNSDVIDMKDINDVVVNNNMDVDAEIKEQYENNPFAIPSNIWIEPILENITMDEINNWKSSGRYSFNMAGQYIHSAGHIAVVYHKDNKLEVAFHQRAHNMKRGAGRFGWPGGIADKYDESIWTSVLRELKEECMSKTKHSELNEKNIHLFYAKKTYHKPLHFYALFVVFIDNKLLITGPDKHSQWEVVENKEFGMVKENGYHNLFGFNVDPIARRYAFENKDIDNMLWNVSTMRKLAKAIQFNDLNLQF